MGKITVPCQDENVTLTEKEVAVLDELITEGKTDKEIAAALGKRHTFVRNRMRFIGKKTKFPNRTKIALWWRAYRKI